MRLVNGTFIGQLFDHHGLAEIYVHLTAGALLFGTSIVSYLAIRRAFRGQQQGWALLRVGIAFSGLIGLGETGEHFFVGHFHDFFHYLHMIAAPASLFFYYYAMAELRALYFDDTTKRLLKPMTSLVISFSAIALAVVLALASQTAWDRTIEIPFLWLTMLPSLAMAYLVLRQAARLYSERDKLPVINLSLFSTVLASIPLMAAGSVMLAVTIWLGRLSDNLPELSFFYAGSHIWLDIWLVLLASVLSGGALALMAVRDVRKMQERILASARLLAFGEVAAEVADQLRTPISLIKNYAALLAEEPDLPEALRTDAKAVGQEAMAVETLAQELLALVDKSDLKIQVTNLKQLMDDSLAVISSRLRNGGVRVTRKFEKPLPFVAVDRSEVRRAILSLLGNAADAMPQGGRIHLGASRNDGWAVLVITDQGPGIEPEHQPFITDPFFSTKGGRGNGLGLPLAKAILERSGGTLEITSTPGSGTTATVRLPAVDSEFIDRHISPQLTTKVGVQED